MLRATASLLLTGGVALLVTWGVQPAQSQSARTVPRVPAADALAPLPAELNEINLEVERLAAHLARQVALPEPARDPFHFATPSRPVRALPDPIEQSAVVVEPARPAWPSLVAIMAKADTGGFEVALTDRDGELHVVAGGGALNNFIVSEITSDAVVLTDQPSGQTTRLTIR